MTITIPADVADLLRQLADLAVAPGRTGAVVTVLLVAFIAGFICDVAVALFALGRAFGRAWRRRDPQRRRENITP